MKNTTLLKVLSATAIFSAVAAIEAYDQDSFAFAAEETPVVANTTTSTTQPTTTQPTAPASTTGETNSSATPAVNSAAAPATTPATASTTPKAEEPATVAQDVKALKDGEYNITAEAIQFGNGKTPSMAAAGLEKEKTKLIVKNGQYSVNVTFKSITIGTSTGYLGDLKYYDGDKTHNNRHDIEDNEFKPSTIVESYKENETDNYFNAYKKKFPNRTAYPKTLNFNVDKNKIDSNNKLETYTEVFVPVMDSSTPGAGTQRMILKFDLSSLSRKKVTADNYEAATYENPNKDVEYKGTIKKDFPIHVQGHLRNANNNDEESLYGSALDNYVKVEKVGDKYKYTLRFKKGLADVGGEFYPFELHKVAYQGKDVPLTTLATNGNSSVKEGSIITDKLLEKIQLDGTAPYPNGALMSHFVTLKLYYETATDYKERPVKLEDVVAPAKPKPVKPAPTTPKEEPKPATPTAADHNVDADKVPNTFPTTVKAELNGRTTGTASIYENAFVKDVKVEKVGNKYQYTIQVKEGKSTNFLLRNKPFTVSKLSYKGTEINFTEVDAATKLKEGKILTDSLLDKIQVDAVLNVQTKGGAKPRFEDRTAESTIALDFPKVEKPKEVTPTKPSVPDHEVDADKVPTTFPATVKGELNGRTTNSSSIYENAFVKDVKVEKVGDKYQYTIQVKEGKSTNFLLRNKPFTVSKLTYKGTEINFTEVDAATKLKEGKILTDSLLDKIQVDAVLNVQTKGGAKPRFEDRAAESTIALDFPKVEKPKEVTPAKPSVPDHEVAADKVPTTFPATVKGELNGRTTDSSSIYENAFVKDVKVEKVGDKYQYTIQVKEGKSSTYLLRNKPFTVSKLSYKGTEINFTEVDAATKLKEGKILTDTLLDKIQVDTVISVQTKGGAKPRFEERAAESTIALDFPTAEKVKEEAANNLVPAKINNENVANKPSMADGALVHEKTRVEKVNDAYHYYLTFKDLRFGTQVGTVDTLTVDNAATERTDLGGEEHEKVFHFTSPEKLTEKTITFSVSVNGKPLIGHSNVAATLKFNWEAATPLTTDQVTSLHKDETTRAQAEKEKLVKEEAAKAEKERLEKERLEKAQKAEADRLEKEAAAKAQAEKEKLEKEKAKLEELKKEALANIANNKDVNKEEASKLKEIVNSASLKDTLVAKVVENGSSEEIKVSFDNSTVKASNFSVEKADKETVAKVEELVKKADENLSVVKTIDLHFTDSKGTRIDKQGETRAVTVAVVANEDEKLEVYYVNGNKLEKVPSVYKDGKLTFFTNHFSLYTIVKSKTVASDQNTPVPVTPVPSENKPSDKPSTQTKPNSGETPVQPEGPGSNEKPKFETGEALVQPELPEFDIKELNKEQKEKEQAQPSTQDIFGQNENKEDKKAEAEKTTVQKTSQTVAKGLKALANTGVNSTATVGLGALVLLSALVLRRKNNK